MSSSSRPRGNQLVLFSPTSARLRIRSNIAPLKPIRLYMPDDDDDSVHYTFALGRHIISTANSREEALLTGYFSALCVVFPDLIGVAKMVLNRLAFKVEEVMIPSQAARMNIQIPRSDDQRLGSLDFLQICFLPFLNKFDDSKITCFLRNVAYRAGIKLSFCKLLCSVTDMETISSALFASGTGRELRSSVAASLKALAKVSTPLGSVVNAAALLINPHDPRSTLKDLFTEDLYAMAT